MELAPLFLNQKKAEEAKEVSPSGLLLRLKPPSQRKRMIRLHGPGEEDQRPGTTALFQDRMPLTLSVSATVDEVLKSLLERWEPPQDKGELVVYQVPPAGRASEDERDELAINVRGLAFLAGAEGAEHNINPNGKCGQQWKQLLHEAGLPLRSQDRIGLRTKELWLGFQDKEEDIAEDGDIIEYFLVTAKSQVSSAKKTTSYGTCQVRLPVGATVATLRNFLGNHNFPKKGRVLAELPGKGSVTLTDADRVPDEVTLTDFRPTLNYYTLFSPRENKIAFRIIIKFWTKPENKQRLVEFEKVSKGDETRYGFIVGDVLANEVYPAVFRHFGMPQMKHPIQAAVHLMKGTVWDVEASFLWVQSEMAMNNVKRVLEGLRGLSEWPNTTKKPLVFPKTPLMDEWYKSIMRRKPEGWEEIHRLLEKYNALK